MKKRRIIIAVISIIVVAAMVLFDMLYMKRIKKRNCHKKKRKLRKLCGLQSLLLREYKVRWKRR